MWMGSDASLPQLYSKMNVLDFFDQFQRPYKSKVRLKNMLPDVEIYSSMFVLLYQQNLQLHPFCTNIIFQMSL